MRGLRYSRHAPSPGDDNTPNYSRPTYRPWTQIQTPTLAVTPASPGDATNNDNNLRTDPGPPNNHVNHVPPCHSPPPSASSSTSKAKNELARYTMIRRRLEWKLDALEAGYERAVHRVGQQPEAADNANIMFKLDFFEYYMLIERALVHLLGVFGVDVPRGYSPARPPREEQHTERIEVEKDNTKEGEKKGVGLAASKWKDRPSGGERHHRHRYHANVLAALDREDSPLHGILGTGEVRRQLQRAKDLRNRWKTAGDENNDDPEFPQRTVSGPLESYNLGDMLRAIFKGFDEAYRVAEIFVQGQGKEGVEADTEMVVLGEEGMVMGQDEAQWEFMVDAMDWEAV